MSHPKLLAPLALTCGMHLMAPPHTEVVESRIFQIGAQPIDAEVVVGAGHDSSLFRSSPEVISAMNKFFATGEARSQTFRASFIPFELPPGEK